MANKDAGGRRIGWRRVLLPAAVLVVGLFVVAPVAGMLSGKLTSVTENDQAAFLPDSAESTKSLELETRFAGAQDIPALIVWERAGGLTDADLAAVDRGRAAAERRRGRRRAGIRAHPERGRRGRPGRRAAARGQHRVRDAAGIVEDVTAAAQVEGLPSYVTGPGGQFADFAAAFEGIDSNLLFTTVGVILVILLLIYRSAVFLPVLVSAGLALVLAQAVVYLVADAGILTVDGQSQGILLGARARCQHRLRVAADQPVQGGAAPRGLLDGGHADRARGARPADRRLRRHGHARPAVPAPVRPQQQQVARTGRRDRDRLRRARDDRASCPRC